MSESSLSTMSPMRIGIGAAALIVMAYLAYHNTTEPNCENQLLLDSSSPDHTKRAVIYGRSCTTIEAFTHHRTTTDYCTHVSILPAFETIPNRDGNVFAPECERLLTATGGLPDPPLRIRWISDRELLVGYGAHVKVHHRESEWNGINIRFKVFGAAPAGQASQPAPAPSEHE